MGTFLLQPHHKQISRSSSQAINIQGISFLFFKEKGGSGDLDSFPLLLHEDPFCELRL